MTQPSRSDVAKFRSDPAAFRGALLLDADGGPRPYGELAADWQEHDFLALDSGWLRCIGRPADGGRSRGYLERGRGASKTTDLAVMAAWALLFGRRLRGFAAAADEDQAALLREALERLVSLNLWVAEVLEVQRLKVCNLRTGSELVILSSDGPTSYGLTPDFVIVDELVHHRSPALWESLLSSVAKRRDAVLVVISNAGTGEGSSWQWKVREAVRSDPAWYFSRLDGTPAWIGEDRLAEQRRLLPDIAYRRLWLNEWTSGAGDAFDESDLAACYTAAGPMAGGEAGWRFVGGLDLSTSKDHSSFVIVGKSDAGRYRLARAWTWRPPGGGRHIDQAPIERTILEAHAAFRLEAVGADPFQSEYIVTRLAKAGVPVKGRPQQGAALVEQCLTLLEQISSHNLELYRYEPLDRDLMQLRVEERSYGMRLVSSRGADGHGHGDNASALSIALAAAKGVRMNVVPNIPASAYFPSAEFIARFNREVDKSAETYMMEFEKLVSSGGASRSRKTDAELPFSSAIHDLRL